MDSVLDRSRASDDFPTLQDHQTTMTERPTQPHHARQIDSDLVIMATLERHTMRRRPLPATGLCMDDYEALMENSPRPYPFGLEGGGSAYHITDPYVIDPTNSG